MKIRGELLTKNERIGFGEFEGASKKVGASVERPGGVVKDENDTKKTVRTGDGKKGRKKSITLGWNRIPGESEVTKRTQDI